MSQLMTIARPYAESAFEVAQEHRDVPAWASFIEKLAVLGQSDEILRLYHSPKIEREALVGVIVELTGVAAQSRQANFVRVLLANKRLNVAAEIAKRFVQLQHQAQDELDVNMVTAVQVDDKDKTRYTQKIAGLLGRKIVLHCTTDKDILGGFIIRYDDKVIDSSIRGQINKLTECLAD